MIIILSKQNKMESQKISIVQNGEKVREISETQIVIETDKDCFETLKSLEKIDNLTERELNLLKTCQSVTCASVEDCLSFDFLDFIEFTKMSEKYPNYLHQIIACSDYLNSVCDFEGEITPDFYLTVAQAYGCLMPTSS